MIGVFWYILLCRLNGYEYLVIRYLCDVVVVDFFLFSIAEIVMCTLSSMSGEMFWEDWILYK